MSSINDLRPKIDPVPLESILDQAHADSLSADVRKTPISGLSVDSSDMESGWVFVAISGIKNHGIRFAPAAVRAGAVAVVTDAEGKALAGDLGVPIVVVEDPRLEASFISCRLYKPYFEGLTLVGVTGTNGKTTTTYLVRGALQPKFERVALMGTMEIAVGRPGEPTIVSERTTAEAPVIYRALVVAAQNGYGAAVVEASSHALSLHRIAGLHFDSVIFTNLQHDHLDFYGSMENYFDAKAQLFSPQRASRGVVSVDDRWGEELANTARIPVATVSALGPVPAATAGSDDHWQVTGMAEDATKWGIAFTLVDPKGVPTECFCPLPGRVNVQNSAVALVCATQVGVPFGKAVEGLAKTTPPPGRMEVVPTRDDQPRILVDYAHTPEAFAAAIETLRPLVTGELILVFGTDGDRDATKREPLGEVAARMADRLWITDENPRTEDPQQVRDYLLRGIGRVRPDLDRVVEIKTSRRDAIRKAIQAARPGDLVAILGKGAEPYQEIDGVKHAQLDSHIAHEVARDTKFFN